MNQSNTASGEHELFFLAFQVLTLPPDRITPELQAAAQAILLQALSVPKVSA